MSVTPLLRQIPISVLEQINQSSYESEVSAKMEVYSAYFSGKISYMSDWEKHLNDLVSKEYLVVLQSLNFDIASMIDSMQVLKNTAQVPEIDLGNEWHDLAIFLTDEYSSEKMSSFVASEKVFNNSSFTLVNSFFGQAFNHLEGDHETYFSGADVQNISAALDKILEDFDNQWLLRWDNLEKIQEGTAKFSKSDDEEFRDNLNELVDFYRDASEHNNAVYVSMS
jgi:Domain of unknown function (DUF1877)